MKTRDQIFIDVVEPYPPELKEFCLKYKDTPTILYLQLATANIDILKHRFSHYCFAFYYRRFPRSFKLHYDELSLYEYENIITVRHLETDGRSIALYRTINVNLSLGNFTDNEFMFIKREHIPEFMKVVKLEVPWVQYQLSKGYREK